MVGIFHLRCELRGMASVASVAVCGASRRFEFCCDVRRFGLIQVNGLADEAPWLP